MALDGIDKANWMAALARYPVKITKPLNQLPMPGSHDSFTYSLNEDGPISNDESSILQAVGKIPFVKHIVYSWSVTQQWTVTEQLDNGIRYFDLRTSHPDNAKDEHELRVLHGLYGASTYDLLAEIKTWLLEHPKEVVLFDFNHYYNMSNKMHQHLWQFMTDTFGGLLCPRKTMTETTLQYCWAHNYQVIAFFRPPSGEQLPPFLWSGDDIDSPYANSDSTAALLDFLTDKLKNRSKNTFFVTQGIETERAKDVAANLTGSLIDVIGSPTTEAVVGWLTKNQTLFDPVVNVVFADVINRHNFVDTVLAYNFS